MTMELKTKRLRLRPMSLDKLTQKAATAPDPELRQAYEEKLAGCRENPDALLWYIPWEMLRKEDDTVVGNIGFQGVPRKGTVELGYDVKKDDEGQGYTTEAVAAMADWAFAQSNVYYIEAKTTPENRAAQRVLEKNRFQPMGEGEKARFRREKPRVSWISIYLCFGVSIGLAMGNMMNNHSAGLCSGMAIALCLGAALDAAERKRRKAILEGEK